MNDNVDADYLAYHSQNNGSSAAAAASSASSADAKAADASTNSYAQADSLGLVIKPRRFRITVWLLDTNLDPVEELDEICAFTCNYNLNSIPSASFTPGVGVNVKTLEPSKLPKRLDKLTEQKAPIGICVETYGDVSYATIHTTNDEDIDREKWPKEKVFIFKGYIAGYSLDKNSGSFRITVSLNHWLQDLAILSMYSPRAHVNSGEAFAADLCRTNVKSINKTLSGWGLSDYSVMKEVFNNTRVGFTKDGEKIDIKNTIWDCVLAAIRSVLITAKTAMDSCALGKVDPDYLVKQDNALKRLRSCLEYKDNIRAAINTCLPRFTDTIDNSGATTWICKTVWDKIAGPYMSLFYYAIAPTAGWAYIIPTPSTIPDKHIDITQDEILNLRVAQPVAPVLGAVAMATKTGPNVKFGGVYANNPIMYPPIKQALKHLKDSIGGPIDVIKPPVYLENFGVDEPPDELKTIEIADVPKMTVRPKMEKAREYKNDICKQQQILLYDLVTLDFLAKVFAARRCIVSMAFRGDIVPGACVHIHATPPVNVQQEVDVDIYGTVESVTIQVDGQGSSASTNITLNNIRNKKEFESWLYNPDIVPFYSEQFNGTEVTLYCPFGKMSDNANAANGDNNADNASNSTNSGSQNEPYTNSGSQNTPYSA